MYIKRILHECVGVPIGQLGERQTLDRKDADSILKRGAVLQTQFNY